MLGHVCGCVCWEKEMLSGWMQPPGETLLYGLSISEPHHIISCIVLSTQNWVTLQLDIAPKPQGPGLLSPGQFSYMYAVTQP